MLRRLFPVIFRPPLKIHLDTSSLSSSQLKHGLHCFLLLTIIICFEISSLGIQHHDANNNPFEPFIEYGTVKATIFYLLRILTLLALPQSLFNFFGLVFYNAFSNDVELKGAPLLAPFFTIRTVTRGDYPELVKANVERNMNTCLDLNVENFIIEVVTDKCLNLPRHPRIREVVVPSSYQTKSGALFKARALQYALEDGVNLLNDSDWIVHLDEETLLTPRSVRGILNFIMDGQYHFGQGLITYANESIVNYITTLADSFRVADDMGKLRFQFKMFHKPLFSWKGSYVVSQVGAEKRVTFDNGPDGSIAEDCFFSLVAFKLGYDFDFIEGEMWEKSPFTLSDFLKQRKRWLQGIFLVVHSPVIPLKNKLLLGISLYSWATLPLTTANIVLAYLYPLPLWTWLNFIFAFIAGVNLYMYIFGVLKSFSLFQQGPIKLALYIISVLCIIPFNIVIENTAVIIGLLGKKHQFYIVKKYLKTTQNV